MVDRNADSIAQALEKRRATVARVEEVSPGIFTADITFDASGCGEGIQQVMFGVRYTEMPAVNTGWSLKDNMPLVDGSFPQISVGVANWNKGARVNNAGTSFYDGCTLAFKTVAPHYLLLTLHASFRGKGVRGPAGNAQ